MVQVGLRIRLRGRFQIAITLDKFINAEVA